MRTVVSGGFSTIGPAALHSVQRGSTTIHVVGPAEVVPITIYGFAILGSASLGRVVLGGVILGSPPFAPFG